MLWAWAPSAHTHAAAAAALGTAWPPYTRPVHFAKHKLCDLIESENEFAKCPKQLQRLQQTARVPPWTGGHIWYLVQGGARLSCYKDNGWVYSNMQRRLGLTLLQQKQNKFDNGILIKFTLNCLKHILLRVDLSVKLSNYYIIETGWEVLCLLCDQFVLFMLFSWT